MKKDQHVDDLQALAEVSAAHTWSIGIVHACFYEEEIGHMLQAAITMLHQLSIPDERISLYPVRGSFEIPLVGAALAEKKACDALIGLGIIVEGETHHARLVAETTAHGMMNVQVRYRIPFVNEVLYVDALDLAKARLSKGADAARTAVAALRVLEGAMSN